MGIKDLEKSATSQLNEVYSVDNLTPNQIKPWVGDFTYQSVNGVSKTLSVQFNFKRAIQLPYITMKGGNVLGFRPGQTNEEQCYVTRFSLEYKRTDTSAWERVLLNVGHFHYLVSEKKLKSLSVY